jgi:hypothetical protein
MFQITFKTEDNKTLDCRLFGSGSTAILLAHMRPSDQTSWFEFAGCSPKWLSGAHV